MNIRGCFTMNGCGFTAAITCGCIAAIACVCIAAIICGCIAAIARLCIVMKKDKMKVFLKEAGCLFGVEV